ncbi:MAG: protein-L-isoaspartate(D-aspartate) O-methyltransferase [Desulfuromonadales bacterium]|nr:protein-L-isoaspartate(D-aspartate) O-methyltransferase [Desulfuromonadales bacterium]
MSDFAIARRRMVEKQVQARGITDVRVIDAMLKVPRHKFVEAALASQAYSDYPLPIGERQTISQPYIVAAMSEALQLKGDEKVLEVGSGSGYQAAILARMVKNVFTIERHGALARRAREVFDELSIDNIAIRIGDGTIGWSTYAPFNGIVVTAGSPDMPQPLLDQLSEDGGRLVIPVGGHGFQQLKVVTREGNSFSTRDDVGCSFVPLVGKHGWSGEGQ